MSYVTSDMACNEPNSATPMTAKRIAAQNARVAAVGQKFISGNWTLSNLVQTLGGIGIGTNVAGTTPRSTPADFSNSPSSDFPVLPGKLYGRMIRIPGAGDGQPILMPDGTIAVPSVPKDSASIYDSGSSAVEVPVAASSPSGNTPPTVSSPNSAMQSGVYGAGNKSTFSKTTATCPAPAVAALPGGGPGGDQSTQSGMWAALIVALGALGLAFLVSGDDR